MFKWLANLFTGGALNTISDITKEVFETENDKAEARAVILKAMDPNGSMRRQISCTVSLLYCVFILVSLSLIIVQAFDLGPDITKDGVLVPAVDQAISNVTELFGPITTLFGLIVGASFGINGLNTFKNK